MKTKILISLLFSLLIFNSYAQKAENMNELLQNKNLYSEVIAKEIAKNVGLNEAIEIKIGQIYADYSTQLRTTRQNNSEINQNQITELERKREEKILMLLDEKQKEKYNKYKESKIEK